MENYHCHKSWSNIFTPDSAAFTEEYAKRAVELGKKSLSSVEHGWQGYYFETYELAKKYGLKCVIGAEAYWVKDRLAEDESGLKDKSNHHIVILAKNNKGREALNDVLSEASISGYYYRPRLDIGLILSLPPEDVFVTTACIAFRGYEDIDDIILQFYNHFKDNFALEIQYHNTDKQKEWNNHLKELSEEYGINLIVGLDSHYIYEEDAWKRDLILEAKGTHFEDEDGWYMDYPDDETIMNRFLEQGIYNKEEIQKAMDLTDIVLTFDDYDDVSIFNKDIKLPTLYPDETIDQRNKRYSCLITQKFKEYMKNIPEEDFDKYFEGVKMEVQTYKDTGMVDYPLLDYAIVKDAKEHGGLITDSGRGSCTGFFTNTLSGFSHVDRFKSPIKLYPERFISTTRILETRSLPDIDLNVGTVEIFEEAQKRVLGDEHAVPMIAFGTLKKKSAFKIYAKAKNMNFELANTISGQISEYDEAIKYADDDDRDLIDIYDYVDEQYKDYIEQSKEYWGIISDKKKAPSAYLLYQGNIRKEIGLIKCKSESTKKEYITCVIDGAIAENYKFLKNDILKVDVVLLIDKVFKRIGIEHFDVNTLTDNVNSDSKVWDIYKNGYTIGINQVERESSRRKCMNYKPSNISELAAFVAAIRPGFKSMYKKFEAREDFSYGIPALDNLIRTKELPVSYIFFQEQCMAVLNYAGFPMDQCYGIIKAIAKKHPEKVRPLKAQFLKGFTEKIMNDEGISEEIAKTYSDQVWTIINDNCGYSFNSSHAYCMALDSLYQAWQKANYPYEFYETLLQHYTDKGNKNKVSLLKEEMKNAFGISEGKYKFGEDNRKFVSDKNNKCILPALSSIKGLSVSLSEKLYSLSNNNYSSFADLLIDMKKNSIAKDKISTLIKINYFEDFGEINELLMQLEMFDDFFGRSQFYIKDVETKYPVWVFKEYCTKETAATYKFDDTTQLMKKIFAITQYPKTSQLDKIKYQHEYLGYINLIFPKLDENYVYIKEVNGNYIYVYRLKDGANIRLKSRKRILTANPILEKHIMKIIEISPEKKWRNIDGKLQQINEYEDILKKYSVL